VSWSQYKAVDTPSLKAGLVRLDVAPITVGIVATEPMRLAGLASAFDGHPSIRTLMGDLETLLADAAMHFIILDVSENQNWMEIQFMVKRVRPDIQQLVLGPMGSDEVILRSITAGARGYLDVSSGPFAVRLATESMVHGCIWAPRRLLSLLIDRLLSQPGSGVTAMSPSLSPRERQVLDLIMAARSNREIAEELGIEERTVKAYVASLLRKTGADNRVSLSVQATQDSLREARIPAPSRALAGQRAGNEAMLQSSAQHE
jgi:DNA-binding NarL/FixJ family response regulator